MTTNAPHTPATPICALAREADQLLREIKAAESAMYAAKAAPITEDSLHRLRTLDVFYGHACDRLDAIQQLVSTALPECLEDALIVAAVSAQMAERIKDDESFHPSRRAVSRMLTNLVSFLEVETGTTAGNLGAGGFGDLVPSWPASAEAARAILAETTAPAKAA